MKFPKVRRITYNYGYKLGIWFGPGPPHYKCDTWEEAIKLVLNK